MSVTTSEVVTKTNGLPLVEFRLKRGVRGLTLTAKCSPAWEDFMRGQHHEYVTQQGMDPTDANLDRYLVASTRWGGKYYRVIGDMANGPMMVSGNDQLRVTFAKVGEAANGNLGLPDNSYDGPLQVSWLRAVNLSTDGWSFTFPGVMFTRTQAERWATAVGEALKLLYRERLQPFDITTRITVESL